MTATLPETLCPGCGLEMPASETVVYDGYFNTSQECWSVFTEVLGAEFGDAVLFGQVHQLTVDTYAVQHAGGPHPDKSVGIHLSGLHLVLDRGMAPMRVAPMLQRLAAVVDPWPHFPPPGSHATVTVFDVALVKSPEQHMHNVRRWAREVWAAWTAHHTEVADLVSRHLS